MMPTGLRFYPSDEELIEILQRKVYGQEMPFHGYFIAEINIYEFDPQDLQWDYSTAITNNERYCYYLRENDSREVFGRGWWRATGHIKKIYSNEQVVGHRRQLTFHSFTKNDRDRKKAIKTNWIMHEYSLESSTTEWRFCKIKYNGRQNVQNDCTSRNQFEAISSVTSLHQNFVGEQLQPQPSQMNRVNETYFEPLQQPGFGGGQQQQSQPSQLDTVYYEPYFIENTQMEMIDEMQHQPQTSFYPSYYFDDQLEQHAGSLEQPCPSLWSWQN